MPKRRRSVSQPSYSQKAKVVRQFYRVPSGPLTPKKKAFLTRKFNEVEKFTALKFHKATAKERKELKSTGYRVTDKGVFLPQRKGERVELRDTHIKHTSKTKAGTREEFEFPLNDSELALFFDDPRTLTNQLIDANPRIFNPRKGMRRRWRLVFNLGDSDLVRGMDELEEYIKQINEQPVRDKGGEIKISAAERVEQISNNMVGIRVVFFKGNRARAR